MDRLQNLIDPTDGRFVATGLQPGTEADTVKAFQEARLGVTLELVPQRTAAEYGAGNKDRRDA